VAKQPRERLGQELRPPQPTLIFRSSFSSHDDRKHVYAHTEDKCV